MFLSVDLILIHNTMDTQQDVPQTTKKMSRWGIGPIFASLSIGYGIATLLISQYYRPFFEIAFLPNRIRYIAGALLIGFGAVFFKVAVKTVMRAYNADSLVTDGIFKYCRHPLYASWVVFIVPGIVLLANSWLGLTAPIFMYIILRRLVKEEEQYLESLFGSGYVEYKKKVPCILPLGCIK